MHNQSLEQRRKMAAEHITRYYQLRDVARLEPEAMECIVELALCHDATQNRWQAYEEVKSIASQYVGYDASKSDLRTSGHYEVMISFIDWLLALAEKPVIEGKVVEALPYGY